MKIIANIYLLLSVNLLLFFSLITAMKQEAWPTTTIINKKSKAMRWHIIRNPATNTIEANSIDVTNLIKIKKNKSTQVFNPIVFEGRAFINGVDITDYVLAQLREKHKDDKNMLATINKGFSKFGAKFVDLENT